MHERYVIGYYGYRTSNNSTENNRNGRQERIIKETRTMRAKIMLGKRRPPEAEGDVPLVLI